MPTPAPPNPDGVEQLSQLAAGNDHLVTQPGVVQALLQGNATPVQAQAVNQFVGGLNAELKVRTAAAAGTKIGLSFTEQQQLDAMGIDYSGVVHNYNTPIQQLREDMAKQGMQPKLAADNKVLTDKNGSPHAEPLQRDQFGSVIGSSLAAPAQVDQPGLLGAGTFTPQDAARITQTQKDYSAAQSAPHGILDDIISGGVYAAGQVGHNVSRAVGDVNSGLSKAWNLVDTVASQSRERATNPDAYARSVDQNSVAMKRLGYDPGSALSSLAYQAQGYTTNDTSGAADAWDTANPDGKFGMDGSAAVIEAEAFLAHPAGYEQSIIKNPDLSPEQVATRLKAVNSQDFQDLVKRVSADRASIGNDFARGLGIDPVKHSTLHAITATTADVAASFIADPTMIAAGAYSNYQRASVAIKNFHDAESINRILRAGEDGGHATVAQNRVQGYVHDLVNIGNAARAARDTGDDVALAQAQARASANPLGGLLSDFTGDDRLTDELKSSAQLVDEAATFKGNYLSTWAAGRGDPIDTYDKAVTYLSSKAALFRLAGGKAPVEFSTMPGAVSSVAYSKIKGTLSSWSTGLGVRGTEKAVARFVGYAKADPAVADSLINEGLLRRVLPAQDDAVDLLTSRVIAAKQDVKAGVEGADGQLSSAQRALDQRQSELETAAPLDVTPKGLGHLRGNQLRYGTAAGLPEKAGTLARLDSIYLFGATRRARLIVTRLSNQLPRDLTVNVASAADAESIRRLARTYLTSGDSNLLAARWTAGTADTRKAIVQGLREQIYHAAGLTRTKLGRDFLDEQAKAEERYATNGVEVTDAFGNNAAQWPGQVQTEFRLPNFGTIHKAAAKIGLYEGTMGRFLNSNTMDRLNSLWRTAILGSPVTANRAIVESMLAAHVDRGLGFVKALAAKSVLRDTGLLSAKGLHRSWAAEHVANLIGFRDVGRLYRNLLQKKLSTAEIDALHSMPPDLAFERIFQQTRLHWAQEVDPSNTGEASQIAELGLKPTQVRYDTKAGFDAILRKKAGYELTEEVDGAAGANSYAFTLGSRVNAAPKVAKAILDRIENPAEFDREHVIKALDSERLMNDTLYGKVFRDADGTQRTAHTAEQVALGKAQWADNMTDDLGQLLTGRNDGKNFLHKVADYIKTNGHGPDAEWIQDNVKGWERPRALIRPQYAAVVPTLEGDETLAQAGQKIAESVQQFNGKVYQWAVERLIQRNSTTPLYGLAYAKSKVSLQGLKDSYVAAGLSDEAAETIVAKLADKQAWNRVAVLIDDPRIKLQMDVAARSFFAFSRATTVMLRRWATTLWKNPAQARRLQLAYEGAEHSGLIYQDQSGQPMFLLPLTGVGQEVIFHAMSHIPGLQGMASYPVSDFQGRVASIIPGSNNPFQYQTTPFISIGGRALASVFPDYREQFDALDAKLNGTQAQGQSIVSTLLPRLVKQFNDAELADGRDSVMNSAMVGALYNLYAAGKVPPDGATPAEQQQFYDRLKVGTMSTLGVRFLLGTLSPATISTPGDGSKPDFAYAARGIQSMKNEFATLVNDTGGDWARALSIWTYMHPDEWVFKDGIQTKLKPGSGMVYTASSTQGLVKDTLLPSTQKAYDWMTQHSGFVDKYKTLAAYFLPEQKPGDQFSMEAYRAQIEQGFRERKTPQEFLDGVRISGAGAIYYAYQDAKDAQLAKAARQKDDVLAANIRKGWSIWSTQFKGAHPTFADHLTAAASTTATVEPEYRSLEQMVRENEVPGSTLQKTLVANMVTAFNAYQAEVPKYQGTSKAALAAKAAMTAKMQQFFDDTIKADPGVRDVYNAIFRPLNQRLTYSQAPVGGP